MSFGERHPSPEQLEAVAFGWVPAEEAHRIRDHAAHCPTCGPLLAADVEIRARLALLRADEPLVNVVPRVLQRIAVEQPRPRRRLALLGLVATLTLLFAGALLVGPQRLEAAARWLHTIVVREVPAVGQPGAPKAVVGTPGPHGGPIRRVSQEDAARAAPFPVDLPRTVPTGFALADVTVFQPDPSTPPTRVFVTYRRPNAHQPLVLTYQAAGVPSELPVAASGTQELRIDGHRALYVDLAAEGARPPEGDGPPMELGRLILERPDVVVSASGDRRDGLDRDALAAILGSIP